VFKNPRVRFISFDFKNWSELEFQVRSFIGTSTPSFFCCLGTTIRQAGSEENFRLVDYTYVVEFARLARHCRAEQLLVVSALGADKNSDVFYNRTKGEMEASVEQEFLRDDAEPATAKSPERLHFLRPSLLLGDRKDFRFTERLAILAAPVYSPLLIGGLKKYRPIPAERVAHMMVLIAIKKIQAPRRVENSKIQTLL
jgi:uncharacterized protein YbjT (DUF2867 family)